MHKRSISNITNSSQNTKTQNFNKPSIITSQNKPGVMKQNTLTTKPESKKIEVKKVILKTHIDKSYTKINSLTKSEIKKPKPLTAENKQSNLARSVSPLLTKRQQLVLNNPKTPSITVNVISIIHSEKN
jgi:hypothetical protein